MEFDEIFENKQKQRGYYRENQQFDEDRYSHNSHESVHGQENDFNWSNILEKIKNNNKLKLIIIIGGILILAIGIGLIIILWPFIVKLFNYISQNGIQGVMDAITGFLDRLLKGSGK